MFLTDEVLEASILVLKSRARKARRTKSLIFSILMTVIIFMSVAVFYRVTSPNTNFVSFFNIADSLVKGSTHEPESVFLRPVDLLLNKVYPSSLYEVAYRLDTGKNLEHEIITLDEKNKIYEDVDKLIGFYERAQRVSSKNEVLIPTKPTYSQGFTLIAFSLSVIGIVILAIQISVMFIRYYSQLAEEYDSQALALMMSSGDPELAIKFANTFNAQKIHIGKTPQSVYEKALDTISKMADKK